MGDETTQFASRYSTAVALLARFAGDGTHAALRRELGEGLGAAVRGALDAVEALFASGDVALRKWPQRRTLALSRISALRAALDRASAGAGDEARRHARALLEILEPEEGGGKG